MKRFKFYEKNVASSSDMLFSSGSTTASSLFDRDTSVQWTSSGEPTAGVTVTLSWVAPSAMAVSRIALQNHNFDSFNIIYNSTTSNQFSPALSVTSNANSNTLYEFASQQVTSIDINVWETMVSGEEKKLGQLIISNEKIELEQNPDFDTYNPVRTRIGREIELEDGGIVIIQLDQKFRAEIGLSWIPSTTHNSLTAIYNQNKDFVFVPFAANTFTSYWEGQAHAVNWIGDLNIDSFRNASLANGYRGTINIAEIPD